MSLRDQIDSTDRKISFEVRIDEEIVDDVFEVQCSFGLDQINAQATLKTWYRPSWASAGKRVDIWVRINNESAQLFYGELTDTIWEYGPAGVGIECRDLFARLRNKWGGADRTYDDEDDASLIRNLIEAYGIPSSLHSIESSGWTLGTIIDVVLTADEDAWSLIERIDQLAGYRTFTRANGAIYRRRVSGAPGITAAYAFVKGTNIYKATRSKRVDGIVNKAVVKGLEWEGTTVEAEYSTTNEYLAETNPTNPYIAEEISDDLIEDNAKALEVATRWVQDHNRLPETVTLEVPGNPLLYPGMTVSIDHDVLEAEDGLMLVENVQHTLNSSGFVTSARCIAGALSGYVTEPPHAEFDLKMFLEYEDTGSGVDAIYVCIADGSKSYDPDSDAALTYSWEVTPTGGTATPDTGTSSTLLFVLSEATTSFIVELTVTDGDGLTDVFSRTITIDATTMPVEDLYTAEGSIVACTTNGGSSWREATPASGNATCLMPIASAWQAWGTDTGKIYATFDKLRTALVDLGTPNGAVACTAVWIHETDPTRAWAAFSDGKVYFGRIDLDAHTAVWTLKGTIPTTPPREIRESYGAFGELRATSGSKVYISQNSGVSWTELDSSAGTAQRMAAGFDTNAFCYDGDANPVQYESGGPPTFPVLVPAVDGIKALAFGWRDKEIYAADDQNPARTFRSNDALTAFTQTDDAGQQVNHMIRSGNERGVVYLATGDGVGSGAGIQKSTNRLDSLFFARRTGTRKAYMVAYGASHLPETLSRVEIIVPTWGAATGGIWHYIPGVGWGSIKNTGLPGGTWYGHWLAANPFNAGEWLLLLNTSSNNQNWKRGATLKCADSSTNPLWRTTDYGATWSAVTVDVTGLAGASIDDVEINNVEFSTTKNGNWFFVGHRRNFVAAGKRGIVWRGTGNASSAPVIDDTWFELRWGAAGFNDDIVVFEDDSPGSGTFGRLGKHAVGSDEISTTFSDLLLPFQLERGHGLYPTLFGAQRPATATPIERYLYFKDYRATSMPLVFPNVFGVLTSKPASWGTSTADGAMYLGGDTSTDERRQTVLRLTNFLTGPDTTTATETLVTSALTTPEHVGFVRSDRQTRTNVAARIVMSSAINAGNKDFWVFDGSSWTRLTGPASAGNSDLANRVEVLSRPVVS